MHMQEWENWIPRRPGQEAEGFPSLQELCLVSCTKLQGTLPKSVPSLEKLVIKKWEQLLVLVPSLPTVCKLEIRGCKKVVWGNTIDRSSVFLAGLFKQELPKLELLEISDVEELTYLWQNESGLQQDISSLHQQRLDHFPCRLRYLELSGCQRLVKLPKTLLNLGSITELQIINGESLLCFPEVALPSQLRTIRIMHAVR